MTGKLRGFGGVFKEFSGAFRGFGFFRGLEGFLGVQGFFRVFAGLGVL